MPNAPTASPCQLLTLTLGLLTLHAPTKAQAAKPEPARLPAGTAEPSLAKQKLAWRLPDACFVDYERVQRKVTFRDDLRILRPDPQPAAGFYGHEVEDRRTIVFPSSGLPELIPQLALSLSGWQPRAGARETVQRQIDRVYQVGSIRVRGQVVTESADDPTAIRERGSFELSCVEAKVPFAVERNWAKERLHGSLDLSGAAIEMTRTTDSLAGLVRDFEARFTGRLVERKEEAPRSWDFVIEERWRLRGVRTQVEPAFQAAVDAAIAKGTRYLEGHVDQWLGGNAMTKANRDARSYGSGRLALVLLTLVKGSADRQTPRIQQLLAELRQRQLVDTYSLGCALMALEAYYGPPNEAEQLRQGLIDRPAQRAPSAADLSLMQGWVQQILANRDTRVDKGYLLRFNYVAGPRFDNSVTQYGVLGLYSAALCGIEIPVTVWQGLVEHFVDQSGREEGELGPGLRLPTYAQLAREQDPRRNAPKTVARSLPAVLRGFGYTSPKSPTGSMTCAGLTGLGICRAMFGATKGAAVDVLAQADAALRNGFAWLYASYDVRGNPRHDRSWHYYYLYGLERACEIGGVARIHDRDWYFDGAMQLIGTQARDGRWGALDETCFAILFLKKAMAPVRTGR